MSIFLTDEDRKSIGRFNSERELSNLHWALMGRVADLVENPGLDNHKTTTDYWHHAAEFVGNAAFVGALKWDPKVKNWVRNVALTLARLPESAWVGPAFRAPKEPYTGALETTHLTIAVAVALDMVPEAFQPAEREELITVLRERSIVFCRRFIEQNTCFNNWRAILTAGLAVAGAVVGDDEAMECAAASYELCNTMIQDDGSYGESLQYSNYCFYGLMMTCEALSRANPEKYAERLAAAARYPRSVKWFAHSLMYKKPMSGWGEYPRPRSVNFNDCSALFGADPDLLMHIAVRYAKRFPEEAGLARRLFDCLYVKNPSQGPFDRTTFGFVNRFGFLAYMYYCRSAAPIDCSTLPLFAVFDNGNCIARSGWDNDATVLAFNATGALMNTATHLHNDLNSLILAHRQERMLADPGHCCYRNLIHKFDLATSSHNTCTFLLPGDDAGGENGNYRRAAGHVIGEQINLEQHPCPGRRCIDGRPLPPVKRPGKRLIATRIDDVSCFGNDAAEAYDLPLEKFERFTLLCGAHVVFVLDHITASTPLVTKWHWVLNNRDNELEFKTSGTDRVVARRGNCGMKIFHLEAADILENPSYGYIHDAYHVLPHHQGEGFAGSGIIIDWKSAPSTDLTALHAIVVDEYGYSSGYHLRKESALNCSVEEFDVKSNWHIEVADGKATVAETVSGRAYVLEQIDGEWTLTKK